MARGVPQGTADGRQRGPADRGPGAPAAEDREVGGVPWAIVNFERFDVVCVEWGK